MIFCLEGIKDDVEPDDALIFPDGAKSGVARISAVSNVEPAWPSDSSCTVAGSVKCPG